MAQLQTLSNSTQHQHVQRVNRNRRSNSTKQDDRQFRPTQTIIRVVSDDPTPATTYKHSRRQAEKQNYLSAKRHVSVNRPEIKSKEIISSNNHRPVDLMRSKAKPDDTNRPTDKNTLDEVREQRS